MFGLFTLAAGMVFLMLKKHDGRSETEKAILKGLRQRSSGSFAGQFSATKLVKAY